MLFVKEKSSGGGEKKTERKKRVGHGPYQHRWFGKRNCESRIKVCVETVALISLKLCGIVCGEIKTGGGAVFKLESKFKIQRGFQIVGGKAKVT